MNTILLLAVDYVREFLQTDLKSEWPASAVVWRNCATLDAVYGYSADLVAAGEEVFVTLRYRGRRTMDLRLRVDPTKRCVTPMTPDGNQPDMRLVNVAAEMR